MSTAEALSGQPAGIGPSEQTLIARAQMGDATAFGDLFATHRDELLGIANGCVGHTYGDDVVQNAAIKTFRGIGGFEDRNNRGILPWLARAVRNSAVDHVRYERARPVDRTEDASQLPLSPREHDRLPQVTIDPDKAALSQDSLERVEAAFAALKPHQAKLFRAVYLEGLTLAEYSQREGIAVGSAKSAHSRGKAELARLITSGEVDLSY